MSESKPEANNEAALPSAPPGAPPAVELTDRELDEAAGGGWPNVITTTTCYKPI